MKRESKCGWKKEKMKNLVICPSRGRPDILERMVYSLKSTAKMSKLIILLDDDDPCLIKYENLCRENWFSVGKRCSVTQRINDSYDNFKNDFDFFSVSNDDFIYHSEGWDLNLIGEIELHGKYGISYGNDLLQGAQMPTTSVISREIVDVLGWLQLPSLTHLYGDSVWKHLGNKAGCLHYRPDVIIEHCHPFANKSQRDETFERTNSKQMYADDGYVYSQWLKNQSETDIQKVKDLIYGKS